MALSDAETQDISAFRHQIQQWYRRHRRDLPWRRSRDPYAIWVSEIMLQQTRVAAVVERYSAFLERFPTVTSLAEADEQDVLSAWSGLGYYRRARMLHQAARLVVAQNRGELPVNSEALHTLPGIGAYTAAAIASIAYGECVAVVDGNVERVLCRVQGWEAPNGTRAGALKRKIAARATVLVDPAQPGDFNQAMMELGAMICTPQKPACSQCPVSRNCKTRGEHRTAVRPAMLTREIAHALTVRARRAREKDAACGEVLLEQRPLDLSVMPGMWELPALRDPIFPESELRLTVRHAIMQVNYRVRIRTVPEKDVNRLLSRNVKRRWVRLEEAAQMALTGLARKVLKRTQLLPTKGTDERSSHGRALY